MSELRSAVGAILDAVESELGETIELNADHYWLLESTESVDLSKTPDVVSGQLSDDLDSIRAIADGQDVVVWHDIDHLLGLLRRVSALAAP